MVTVPEDSRPRRALLDEVIAYLAAEGLAHGRPPLGMMVEVPAAAIAIDLFDADFFSIGSNDLTQYVTAAGATSKPSALWRIPPIRRSCGSSRRSPRTARDRPRGHPLRRRGGQPALLPQLTAQGLRSLSSRRRSWAAQSGDRFRDLEARA